MGRRRSLIITIIGALALASAGCGSLSDSSNSPPPTRVHVSIGREGARATPDKVALQPAGNEEHPLTEPPTSSKHKLVIVFLIENRLDHATMLEIHEGPFVNDDVNSDPIPPHSKGTLRTDLATGRYQLNGDEIPTQTNGEITVGPYRPAP